MTGLFLEAAENNAKQAISENDVLKKEIADLIKEAEKLQKPKEENEAAMK